MSARLRILFVDDEPMVLRALQRELRAYGDRWDATFASGGEEGMQQLTSGAYDILVTDMVMPGIDGAALLHFAREHHPGIVRIVLSSHSDHEHALRSLPFAHQRLLKPWSHHELVGTLTRASGLRALVGDDLLRRSVGQVGALPSPQASYARLAMVLDAPGAGFTEVAGVIAGDMAMSAKMLQLANSAFVGAGRVVRDVAEAVRLVGLGTIRDYLLKPYLNVFDFTAAGSNPNVDGLGQHAKLTAAIAENLAPSNANKGQVYVTCMMHDIGELLLMTRIPETAKRIAEEAKRAHCPIEAIEQRELGLTHAEVGGFLLGLWGLPQDICDAVSAHHSHSASVTPLGATLRAADWLAHELEARNRIGIAQGDVIASDIDESWFAPFGGIKAIPGLIAQAAATAAGKV